MEVLMKFLLAKFIFFAVFISSAQSFAGDIRLSYVLGIPNFGGSPSKTATLKQEATVSSKFEMTYLSNKQSGFLASTGFGEQAASYYLPQIAPTPYDDFESDYDFYFAQVGYRFELSGTSTKSHVEGALSLGTGNMNFKRKGGSKINLKNVKYQALDIRYVAPMLAVGKSLDVILGIGVSKGTVKDFTLDSTRYSASDFKTAFFWHLGVGYNFGGE